jgi:pimeloyl-ACP methyl ester carboxylesterase
MNGFRPVVLIHGLGGSFEQNWQRSGWVAALEASGRPVVAFALPGHSSPAPAEGEEDRVVADLVELARAKGPVDAVGFSVGALLLLTAAVRAPEAFSRIALLGLGDVQLRSRPTEDFFTRESPFLRGIRLGAERAGHDLSEVLTFARRQFRAPAFADLQRLRQPVLLVLGDRDPVGPATSLLAGLPDARQVTLTGVDHGGTWAQLECQAAVLDFLG